MTSRSQSLSQLGCYYPASPESGITNYSNIHFGDEGITKPIKLRDTSSERNGLWLYNLVDNILNIGTQIHLNEFVVLGTWVYAIA